MSSANVQAQRYHGPGEYLARMWRGAPWSRLMLVLLGMLLAAASVRWRILGDEGNAWKDVIISDGAGYHAHWAMLLEPGALHTLEAREDHLVPAGHGAVIKYMVGTPLMQAPMMLVAHAIGLAVHAPPDARAFRYQIALAVAGVLWTLIGLAALRALLLRMGFPDGAVAISLLIVLAGTGLVVHTVMSPGMSHPCSFAAVALLLLGAHRAWHGSSVRWTIASAGLFALVVLVRPVNGIVLLALPVVTLGGSVEPARWWRHVGRRALLPGMALFAALAAIQPTVWWLQSGAWFVRPYSGEGFLWWRPQVWKSLAGAQKGLFFHWPLLLLGLPGAWPIWRCSRPAAIALVLHAVAMIYLTSAWWSWEYGDSYGPRPYLDHLAIAAIPITAFLGSFTGRASQLVRWSLVPFIALQLFHAWQYTVGIIHPFNMDREKWKAIRFRTDSHWRGALGGDLEPPPYAPCGLEMLTGTFARAWTLASPWVEHAATRPDAAGRTRFLVSPEHPFGPTLRVGPEALPTGRAFHLEVSLRRGEPLPGSSHDALVVTTLGTPGASRVHYAFRLNDLPFASSWRHWRYAYRMPAAQPGEHLSWYVWQPGSGEFLLDSISVRIMAVRPCE